MSLFCRYLCMDNNATAVFMLNLDDILVSVDGAATVLTYIVLQSELCSENKYFKSCLLSCGQTWQSMNSDF